MTLLAAIAAYFVFFVHRFDGEAIGWARANTDDRWLNVLAAITDIGKTYWYLVPAGIVIIALSLVDWRSRTRRLQAMFALIYGQAAFVFLCVGLGEILNAIVKVFFGRARPVLFDQYGPLHFDPFTLGYAHASFPSGHSVTVGVVSMVLMIWLPRWRVLILPLGALLAASRVAADAHYPSDVLAGFVIGSLATLAFARWLGLRGAAFVVKPGKLIPTTRFAGALRRR